MIRRATKSDCEVWLETPLFSVVFYSECRSFSLQRKLRVNCTTMSINPNTRTKAHNDNALQYRYRVQDDIMVM